MADLPGLIEGAHEGTGLGFEFLRHIERTRIIVHILDIMPADGSDPVKNYKQIRKELEQYSELLAKKKEVIVANKIDLDPEGKMVKKLRKRLSHRIYPISAVTGEGIKDLCETLWKKVQAGKKIKRQTHNESYSHRYRQYEYKRGAVSQWRGTVRKDRFPARRRRN